MSEKLFVTIQADGTVPVAMEVQRTRPLLWGTSHEFEVGEGNPIGIDVGGEVWVRSFELDAPTDAEGTIISDLYFVVTWFESAGFECSVYETGIAAFADVFDMGMATEDKAETLPIRRPGAYPAIPRTQECWSTAWGWNEDDEGYIHVIRTWTP